jgi:tripeptide aminopeptidase
MDTSPSEPGNGVKPVFQKAYSGGDILFEDDAELLLNPKESPELAKFIGEDIITAAGKTLLGADDKAGIASIMAALALFLSDSSLPHPELKICFTPDEEVGRGVDNINLDKLAKIAYTIDGGELGELEAECFDAWSAVITFTGRNVHPGSSKNVMINSAAIAARYAADIPEWQSPEHTEKREGFYHLTSISGEENSTVLRFILRDFEAGNNEQRMQFLQSLAETYRKKYPGLIISLDFHHSYLNMYHILKDHQAVIDTAAEAMREVGIDVLRNAIRGGTDGARLCYMGIPTPNIFGGGVMFHSRREWIPVIALQKAAEVVVKIAEKYSK